MIYFDNAATTAISDVALQVLMDISRNNYGNPSSVYSYGRKTKELLEEARYIIAGCIGALTEEVFFTSGGTESDNWVISHAVNSGIKKIITSQIEHHAVLHPVQKAESTGAIAKYISVDKRCLVNQEELKNALDGTPILASIMLQNNETGTLQRIKELADIVHEDNKQSIFHTDAVQAVGHINIDVKALGIDMLSASAHKFNGPKGVGFLYVKKGCTLSPFVLGGGQEKGMRSGTENVAGIYAMAKALEENVQKIENHQAQIKELETCLFSGLTDEGIKYIVNSDSNCRATGIINIALEGMNGEGLLNMLDMQGICISVGSACNSESQDRSHVLKAIGLDDDTIDSSVRISIGRYNTENDVKKLVKCIKRCWKATALAEA